MEYINNYHRKILAPLIVTMWTLAIVAIVGQSMVQGDTLWHIKAGEWIINHHCVPKTDPFSWTAFGMPWHAHEWLWEVLAYLCWQAAGKWGVWCLMALGGVLFGLGAYFLIARFNKDWAFPISLIVIGLSHFFWCARPHTLAQGLFAVWFALFAAAEERPRLAFSLLLISAFWANIHSSAPSAPLFALAWIFADSLEKKKWNWKDPRFMGAMASLFAVVINPWGFGIFPYMVKASTQTGIINYVEEWLSPDFHLFWGKLALAAIAITLIFWDRIPVKMRAVMGAALLMSLVSRRHFPLFFYFYGAGMAVALFEIGKKAISKKVFAIGGLLVFAASVLILTMFLPPSWLEKPQEEKGFPVKAVEWMKDNGLTGKVFNLYTWGGYLIWNDISPFIDGRADLYELSGSGALQDYRNAVGLGASLKPDQVFYDRGVQVVLYPRGTWLDKYLGENRNWKCVYKDDIAVVYKANHPFLTGRGLPGGKIK